MDNSKLGSVEAIALIVIIILNYIVSTLPKALLTQCGSSILLNLIYITILVFLFLWIMLKLWKKFSNNDILDISEFLGGKIFKYIIGTLFIIYFLIVSAILLRCFAEMLKLVYYENLAIWLIMLFFLIVCIIANNFGFRSIIKSNMIIFPIILLNLLIAFFCAFSSNLEIERIYPILGYGINETFFSGISNLFAFSGLAYIYFLRPLLKKPTDFNKISYISIGISAFYLFLSVATLLFSFADITTINELSPIYMLIRSTNFGTFLQRPDALFILGWILALMSYLSINVWLVSYIFKKVSKIQNTKAVSYVVSAIMFILALIPKNVAGILFMQNTVFCYFTIILVFIISFIILLLANIKIGHNNEK
jgi:spore germination protein